MLAKPAVPESPGPCTLDPSIYTLAYNGFYDDQSSLLHIMDLETDYLNKRKQSPLHICTLFYNTNITPTILAHYIDQLTHAASQITKVAIIGIPLAERPILKAKLLKDSNTHITYRFFSTKKEAKLWLSN